MPGIALEPRRAETTALAAALVALSVVMMIWPALCVPLSLLTPLLGCPLAFRREEPAAWAAAVAPTLAALLGGRPPLYAASLSLAGLATMSFTRFAPAKTRMGAAGALRYTACVALSLTAVAACASVWLGAPLWLTLGEWLTAAVEGSGHAAEWLLRLASAGLLSMPEGGITSAFARAVPAAMTRQMALSLRLNLQLLLRGALPALLVQASLLVGVFASLRVSRFRDRFVIIESASPSEKRARVAAPPGFGELALPRSLRAPLVGIMAVSVVLMLSGSDWLTMAGQLGYALFESVFMLLGAAVVANTRDEDRRALRGALAAALYLLAPVCLFALGVADQLFHFRRREISD